MALGGFVYVPMRRDLRSLGRQFGIDGWVGWGCYVLAVSGVASVVAIAGSLPGNGLLTAGCWLLYFPGWAGVAYAASNHRCHRRLRAATAARTGAVTDTDGLVAVSGEVAAVDERARTPLLGEPAVCYTWAVERHRRWPRPNWSTAAIGQGGVPFRLDDGSGPVRVDPTGAEFRLTEVASREVDADDSPPSGAVEFLAERVDFDPDAVTHRYEEYRMSAGETGYVLGEARSVGDGGAGEATTAVGGERLLIGAGSVETARGRLGRAVRVTAAAGAAGVALGYAGMLGLALL